MGLATFSELKTAITTWALRTGDTEFVASVPDFITLCEARTNRILRVREMEAVATLTLASGEVALPADYLAFRDVTALGYDPVRSLQAVSPDYATNEHPYGGTSGGYPDHFSIAGSTLRTHPSAGTGDIRLRYFAKIPALSDAAPTNWLLTKAPGVYLYGSLLEAAPYMMDDARSQVWGSFYDKAIEDLKAEDHTSRYMRGQIRKQGATP